MFIIKRFLAAISAICLWIPVHAQVDTEFWFAVPEVSEWSQIDRPVNIVIATGAAPASVSITQPAAGSTMPAINLTIPANTVHKENMTPHINILECKPAATVLNYGLRIVSDVPVTVYYEVLGRGSFPSPVNPEVFALKGGNALGTSFLIPSQNYIGNNPGSYTPQPLSSFDVIATEDNTTVTITPAVAIQGGYPAGVPFSVTLNRGQTWSATATGPAAALHLPGSLVSSDKPVAVTVKDDLVQGGTIYGSCSDLIGDQIVPVNLLGTEYIAMNGGLMNTPGDQLFITALQNSTEIYRDGGGTPLATINAGDTYRMPAAASPGQTATYIRTTNPVTIWQLTGVGCEMGATQLPQIECSGSSSVRYTRSLPWDLYVNLMVPAGGQSNFTINGTPLTTAVWTAVPGTANQWFSTQLNLTAQVAQGSILTISNSTALFHMSVLDGNGSGGNSYGYFSSYSRVIAEATASANTVCDGDSIQLFAKTVQGGIYQWSGPGSFNSSLQNPVIHGANTQYTGWYHLTVTAGSGLCGSGTDSIYIRVYDLPVTNLGSDIAVCMDSLTLVSAPFISGAAYLWNTGSTADSLVIFSSGSYWLEITDTNGCKSRDTIEVNLGAPIEVDLGPDFGICDKDLPVTLSSPQPPGTTYLWSNGYSASSMTVTRGGTHWLAVERAGCTASDTIEITVVPTPVLYSGSDTTICEQYPLEIGTEVPRATYLWNTGETTAHITVSATGTYTLTVDVDGCVVHDTVHITAMPPPDIDLGGDRDICPEQTIVLDGTHSQNSRYVWSTGEITPSIAVTSAGVYGVEVTTEFGCVGGDTVTLTFYPKPVVRLGEDTTVCEETPLSLRPWHTNADSLVWSDGSVGENLLVHYGNEYIVTAVNKCGTGSDTINVKQIFCDIWLPNVFTPNGDGLNDIFRVLGNTGRLQGVTFSIFNRWGERVFVTNDKLEGWNGYYKGAAAQIGTYVYLLQYSLDGQPYIQKGNFHLLR